MGRTDSVRGTAGQRFLCCRLDSVLLQCLKRDSVGSRFVVLLDESVLGERVRMFRGTSIMCYGAWFMFWTVPFGPLSLCLYVYAFLQHV